MQLFLLDHKRSPPASYFGTFVVHIVPTANIANTVLIAISFSTRLIVATPLFIAMCITYID
jgi:hypothetical protein